MSYLLGHTCLLGLGLALFYHINESLGFILYIVII